MLRTLRCLSFVVVTAFRADPWRAALACSLIPVMGVATAASGWWLKLLADGVANRRSGIVLLAVIALAVSVSLANTAKLALGKVLHRLQQRTGLLLERRLVELTAGLPGLEHHERPDYLDRLEHLRTERPTLGRAIATMVMSGTVIVQALTTTALLASVHPGLALLPLLGLPSMLTSAKAAGVVDGATHAAAVQRRLAHHYVVMASSLGGAKELRLFGLGPEILRRHRHAREAVAHRELRARFVGTAWETLGSLVFLAGYIGAIAFVVWRASLGVSTPGDVLLTLRLADQVQGSVGSLAAIVGGLRGVVLVARHFLWFVDHHRAVVSNRRSLPAPQRLHSGIALENVSFRYPGTDSDVLEDVTMVLPAGSVVALVGENGAGKSTLVKLLSGFYQPTRGRITVDGVDLADIDLDAWRGVLSGVFQDFCKFEFTAREAIGVGRSADIDDDGLVRGAAERGGAARVIDTLSDGLATQLGRTFQGTDLSQGQWQKVALARSRMPRQLLLYILDEPTASLDAASEYELFSEIVRNAGETAADGAVTLLVSHRLSTVCFADLIVVLHEGKVVEYGTHAQLVEDSGIYSELFALQSRAYR